MSANDTLFIFMPPLQYGLWGPYW